MKILILIIVLVCGCGSSQSTDYSSDNCQGVDTAQAPHRIQRVDFGNGHYSETRYYDNYCAITYIY